MRLTWLGILVVLTLQSAALAQTQIRFTQKELSAGVTLMRPELNSLELHEQAGVFNPAPSLRALGIDTVRFDLNFSGLSQLAGIRFDHLRGKTPDVRFEGQHLVISLPVEDQVRAGRTVLGSISVKNVVLRARLAWRPRADGRPELYVVSTGLNGSITGTGALKPSFMISLVQKLILGTLESQITRLINRDGIQDAIRDGLLVWAKLSTGQTWHDVVPGSVSFYTDETGSGLRYDVQ